MIITEIFVPSFEKKYEFKLNENVPVAMVIDELVSIISQYERCEFLGEGQTFVLLSSDKAQILSNVLTLFENDVKTGENLILI